MVRKKENGAHLEKIEDCTKDKHSSLLSKLAMEMKIENICFNYACSTGCSVVSHFLPEREQIPARERIDTC